MPLSIFICTGNNLPRTKAQALLLRIGIEVELLNPRG
jgi:hypothetical protein